MKFYIKGSKLGNEPLCHGMFKDDRVLKKQYLMIEQSKKEYDNIIQKLINPVGKSEKGSVAKVGKRWKRRGLKRRPLPIICGKIVLLEYMLCHG